MENIIKIQDVLDNKISMQDAKMMLIIHQGETYKYFDEGCSRYVFVNKQDSKVIKLAKEKFSNMFNIQEDKIYKEASKKNKKQMCKTKLINGFIEQEFCLPIKFGGKKLSIPERLFASSCRNEVGWHSKGHLVCFDLDEFKKY